MGRNEVIELAIDGFVIDGGQRIAPHVKPEVVFEARKARVEAPPCSRGLSSARRSSGS
jgi:hypothetical protein